MDKCQHIFISTFYEIKKSNTTRNKGVITETIGALGNTDKAVKRMTSNSYFGGWFKVKNT